MQNIIKKGSIKKVQLTGSPFIRVFEGKGQAIVNGCDLDARLGTVLWPF